MFVNANGISLFYELKGQGEPLLLLHGNSEDHHIFDPIVKKFSVNFTTYAIDSRNHGQSQQTNVFKYEPMAEDIYNFIKALNLGKVNLLGFSDGAILSIMLAKNHPETVKKMALLGPNLKPDDLKDEGRKIVEQLYELNKSPLFKMIFEQPNIEPSELEDINVPSLVVGGEGDIFKPEVFTTIAEALPKAELKIVKGHDHISYIVDTDIFYPELIDFFNK